MKIELYLTLAATVTGVLEVIKSTWLKPLQARYQWNKDTYRVIVTVFALATGISLAFVSGDRVNILNLWHIGVQLPADVRHILGLLITGVFISFGNEVVHKVYDAFSSVMELSNVKAETARANFPKRWGGKPVVMSGSTRLDDATH